MPSILKNDDAEALLLDIRTGRTAATQDPAAAPGAFLVFPTSVVTPAPASGHLVFPLRCEIEPGSLVTRAGSAQVSGTVAGVVVQGTFSWTLDPDHPPAASYRFRRRGRDVSTPGWARRLPASQNPVAMGSAMLGRQQSRLRRRARDAEHRLLTLSERHIRHSCDGSIHRALRYRPAVDIDDVVQRSLQAACRLLPLYASPERPPCSWLGMLRLDGRRDLHREVTHLDWLPTDAVVALALADACGVDLTADLEAAWRHVVDAAQHLGRPVPRIGIDQLAAAIRAPALAAQEALAGAAHAGSPGEPANRSPIAAAVARLVSEDADLIALAGAGDPEAIRRVGEHVVRRLCGVRRSTRPIRERAWDEFQRTGRLFASPTGARRFGVATDMDTLLALDTGLRRVAGIRPAVA